MKTLKIIVLLSLVTTFTSCFEPDDEDITEEIKTELLDEISSLEDMFKELGIGMEITRSENLGCLNYFTYIDSDEDGKFVHEESIISEPKDLCIESDSEYELLHNIEVIEEVNSDCGFSQFVLTMGYDENGDSILQDSEILLKEVHCNDTTNTPDTEELNSNNQ